MTPQIELLLVPSLDDATLWFPVAAALAGFPWGREERTLGIIANCPDAIVGVDVDALLAQLTDVNAPPQIVLPFLPGDSLDTTTTTTTTKGTQTQQTTSRTATPVSPWKLDTTQIDPQFLLDESKPVLPAGTVSSALVNV